MLILYILIVTLSNSAFGMKMGSTNNKPLQKYLHRSLDGDAYFQKHVEEAQELLENYDTLPTTDPPDIFNSIPSFLTNPKLFPNYSIPNEKLLQLSSSVTKELPYGKFGPGFKYTLTNIPKHTYSTTKFEKMLNWPVEDGKGTWFTWVTMFPTPTDYTKGTRRTLSPDPLTARMTTRITTELTEYNPVKAWYDREITNSRYFLLSYTTVHPAVTARRRVKSSDPETPVTTLATGASRKIKQYRNTNTNEQPSEHPKVTLEKYENSHV